MTSTFLGIDIGTSAVKAVLVDEAQTPLASATVPLTTSRPHPLWSEQHPDLWWTATNQAVATLRQTASQAFARTAATSRSMRRSWSRLASSRARESAIAFQSSTRVSG